MLHLWTQSNWPYVFFDIDLSGRILSKRKDYDESTSAAWPPPRDDQWELRRGEDKGPGKQEYIQDFNSGHLLWSYGS